MSSNVEIEEPYVQAEQQREASLMGMYLFLAAEIMLFGALIMVLLVVRYLHTANVVAASKQLSFSIGTANTAILLTSSLAVALAVSISKPGREQHVAAYFAIAAVLGLGFLALKAIEYADDYGEGILPVGLIAHFDTPGRHLFMNVYLIATGLHAIHVLIGIAMLGGMAVRLWLRQTRLPGGHMTIEVFGLYWHLVDAVWVFLYPLLYLAR